ncbi:hypothetical protein CKO41_03230 [Thiococcus pfennigii]|nr:LbtU family siderophore porin [Thiococcus pfennigii]MBK1730831.1 hypothetical protein [Thiococcus pfennigii]
MPAVSQTDEEPLSARVYRTLEEQQDAGDRIELTPWLHVNGLIELEATRERLTRHSDNGHDRVRDEQLTVQLGVHADLAEHLHLDAVFEHDSDIGGVETDEFILAVERDAWEMSLGRQYTPLGIYYSTFVTGPSLEFGETRADRAVAVAYEVDERLEAVLAVYRGPAQSSSARSSEWNWAAAVNTSIGDAWSFGCSYQSDLADADSMLLADADNRYARRVGAVSAYLQWQGEQSTATFELVSATRAFEELDRDRDRPVAWNLEWVRFFPGMASEVALRLEGSKELEDEPQTRVGIALTHRISRGASVTVEYLHGRYDGVLAVDDQDEPYTRINQLGAMLSVAF